MDLNQKQVRVLAVVLVIHVILLTLTRRDLRSGPTTRCVATSGSGRRGPP